MTTTTLNIGINARERFIFFRIKILKYIKREAFIYIKNSFYGFKNEYYIIKYKF